MCSWSRWATVRVRAAFGVAAAVAVFLAAPIAFAADLAEGAMWENGRVIVRPCELTFAISDRWTPSPPQVFVPTGAFHGFLLGRQGLVDSQGKPVIPTVGVLWEPITNAESLEAYANDHRPDAHSKDYKLVRRFSARDGSLKLTRGLGFELAAVLNGRMSKVLVIYAIDERNKVVIHISVEVPSEIWPQLRAEVETILSSFEMRPTSGLPVARSSGEPAGADDKCRGAGAAGCASLAVRLAEGDGVVQDGPRAIELFRRACDGSDAGACFNLGLSYDSGLFVAVDRPQALGLYRRACEGGNAQGCSGAAAAYMKGEAVAQDFKRAAVFARKGCDGGAMPGCTVLGTILVAGWGVAVDRAQGKSLFTRACDGKDALGCWCLGHVYDDAGDSLHAAELFRKACALGNQIACTSHPSR
jgi:hypothetical protein